MPYPTIPAKPTLGGRWDSWGDALDASVRQLASDVAALAAAPAPTTARSPFVKPTSATSWPKQTRTAADTLMWLRQWDASTLAPLPNAADGYLPGDLVYPVAATDTLTPGAATTAGVIFSDSLNVTATVDLDGRYGDHALGGSDPAWRADITGDTANGRARVQPNTGLEMYSLAVAYVSTPKLPTTGDLRYTFRIGALADGNQFRLRVRGATYSDPANVQATFKNSSGQLVVEAIDSTSGAAVTTQLGQAAFTPGTSIVTVTIVGSTMTVAIDGKPYAPYAIPAAAARLNVAAWKASQYNSASLRDIKVEAL